MTVIADTVKKAPKWAWFTAAGVGLGAGAIRLYKSRTTADGEDQPDISMPDTTNMGPFDYGSAGASPSGVIVPPVIIGGGDSADQSGMGLGDLQGLYMGGVDSLLGAYENLFGGLTGMVQDENSNLMALATAGAAPTPAAMTPTVVISPTPIPAPAPAPAPVAIGSTSQPTTTGQTCSDRYPNYPHWNKNRGAVGPNSCFKLGCNSKHHKTRYYKDGDVDVLSPLQSC